MSHATSQSARGAGIKSHAMAWVCALLLLFSGAAAQAQGDGDSLRGTLLVANERLDNSPFARTVILVLQNDAKGSLGVVINRRSDTNLSEVLPEEDIDPEPDYPLYAGGPLEQQHLGLLLRDSAKRDGLDQVLDDVGFTAYAHVFDKVIASAPARSDIRVITGYSGWAPGQLEAEIENGAWHILPADSEYIFTDEPGSLWRRLSEPWRDESENPPSLQST